MIMKIKHIDITLDNALKVHSVLYGDPKVANTLVVLIHGLVNDWESWMPFISLYNGSELCFLLIDLPGYGVSGKMKQYSFAEYSQQIRKVARSVIDTEFSTTPVAWIGGLSLGSMIAIQCSADSPDLFSGSILFGPLIKSTLEGPFYNVVVRNFGRVINKIPYSDALVGVVIRSGVFHFIGWVNNTTKMSWSDYKKATIAGMKKTSGRAFAHMVVETIEFDGLSKLSEVAQRSKVVVLAGERDRFYKSPAVLKRTIEGLGSGSRCSIIPNVGHVLVYESPEATLAEMVNLIEEL